MSSYPFGGNALRRGRRIALVVISTVLLSAATASAASAESDISTGLAYANAPGQGVSLPGMAVTNAGPEPAAGVTLTGTVPGTDNDGHAVDWQIFTNKAAISEPFGAFVKIAALSGPPYGADPCTFTSATEYRCDIGPLAVGETRTVVFNPTWEESNTATLPTKWVGFSYTADLVGGTDPEPANNDDQSNFIDNAFYYSESAFGGATNDLQVVEQSPPASGAYEPGATVTLAITSTVASNDVGGSVSVVVPDPDSVTCTGDGVCLTGGPQAMTGPANRVLVAMSGPPAAGSPYPAPPAGGGQYVFTTLLSATLPTSAPAGCAPGKTVPYTFDTTQQPVAGGSAFVSTAIIKLPVTVQISCPEPPPTNPPSNPPTNPPSNPPTTQSVNPPTTQSVNPPTTQSVNPPQHASQPVSRRKPHPHRARPRRVNLRLTKVASRRRVRAGQRFSYLIKVRNAGRNVAKNVRVCDRMPAGLALAGSHPQGKVRKGRLCWRIKRLAGRHAKKFRVVVKALRGSSGRKVNVATAAAPHAKSVRAASAVRITALPPKPTPVTG